MAMRPQPRPTYQPRFRTRGTDVTRVRSRARGRVGAQPRFIDLFSGIGGFRLGFQRAGYKCVFGCEIDKDCRETYLANFGEVPAGDIKNVDSETIPAYDVLTAGFPCQPFSISGKQRGFNDPRAGVFDEIIRIVRDTRPKVVLLENVKHLIHVKGGVVFRNMLERITSLGYDPEWRLVNSSKFGVAQHRERIIIIATPAGERKFDYEKMRSKRAVKLKDILERNGEFDWLEESYTVLPEDLRKTKPSGLIFAGYRNKTIRKAGVIPDTTHLSRVHKQPNRIYSSDGLHPTLPSQESSGRFWVLHDGEVRKLTLEECYKLMGFPKSFKKVSARGKQYQQLGNSVCVPMVTEVATQIRRQLL